MICILIQLNYKLITKYSNHFINNLRMILCNFNQQQENQIVRIFFFFFLKKRFFKLKNDLIKISKVYLT